MLLAERRVHTYGFLEKEVGHCTDQWNGIHQRAENNAKVTDELDLLDAAHDALEFGFDEGIARIAKRQTFDFDFIGNERDNRRLQNFDVHHDLIAHVVRVHFDTADSRWLEAEKTVTLGGERSSTLQSLLDRAFRTRNRTVPVPCCVSLESSDHGRWLDRDTCWRTARPA